MTRRTALVLFFALLVLMFSPASADSPVTVAGVTAGGVNHLIVYPLSDNSKASRVEAALPTIITGYQKLWNTAPNTPVPFQMWIDVELEAPSGDDLSAAAMESLKLPVASAPAEWKGQTEANPTTACHIKLYNASTLNAPNQLEFELALDTARCYLTDYISAAQEDWWYEGLAHWMAVQVYSPPPASLASLQKDYADNYNSSLFDAGQEALYFWEFLLGNHMQNSPFKDVPTLGQSFGNAPKQFLSLTPDLFYAYVNVVADDQLPWQPSADDLADDKDLGLSPLPTDVDLDLEENAIYIANITLPEVEEGKGITITPDGLADSGTMAGIGSAGSFAPLADGAPFDLCGETSITVIAGRALPSNTNSMSPGGPSLTVSEKNDCEKAKLPPCIVGTWQQDVPYTIGSVSAEGSLQHTYRADGSFTEVYSDYVLKYNAQNSPVGRVTYVTTTFTGTMTVERDPKIPGRYNVTRWQRKMEPGGVVTMDAGGQTKDVTSAITMEYFGDGLPSYLQCEKDNAENKHLTGVITGKTVNALGATTWPFTRVP